jgi:hypothetical protein
MPPATRGDDEAADRIASLFAVRTPGARTRIFRRALKKRSTRQLMTPGILNRISRTASIPRFEAGERGGTDADNNRHRLIASRQIAETDIAECTR